MHVTCNMKLVDHYLHYRHASIKSVIQCMTSITHCYTKQKKINFKKFWASKKTQAGTVPIHKTGRSHGGIFSDDITR